MPFSILDYCKNQWERFASFRSDFGCRMESDITVKLSIVSFFTGFFVGGVRGQMDAQSRFDSYNKGRLYLSQRDLLLRKTDYCVVMFAKNGFRMGLRVAAINGTIFFLTASLASWRKRFSFWYFPAVSVLVGSIPATRLGTPGFCKAIGIGLYSGVSISLLIWIYALSCGKSIDETYKEFKLNYEEELKKEADMEKQLQKYMLDHNIHWRFLALGEMRKNEALQCFNDDKSDNL